MPLRVTCMHTACMKTMQIRHVPDEVHEALSDWAQAEGVSLQALLLDIVRNAASRSRNVDLLARFRNRHDGTELSAEEITDAVHAGRERRVDEDSEALPRQRGQRK